MNTVNKLKSMGFNIQWKLIQVGLLGQDEIPPILTHAEVVDYLEDSLTDTDAYLDDPIRLICEKENPEKFDCVLKELAEKEASSISLQKRKWRAYLLKNLLNNISKDRLQGLLALMEFWSSMGMPGDCPQAFPREGGEKAVQEFFSRSSYESNIKRNRSWLDQEVTDIMKAEA